MKREWFRGTTPEEPPENLLAAARMEARSRAEAIRLRLQTVVHPSRGWWLSTTPGDPLGDAYERAVAALVRAMRPDA